MKINHVLAGLWGLAMVAGAVMANSETASAQVACDDDQAQWVAIDVPDTDPQETVDINRKHVFCGEINRRGAAKGFHSRPGDLNPITVDTSDADIEYHRVDVGGNLEPTGLYNLCYFDITDNGQTREKRISTMFPDDCSYNEVLTAIANASIDQDNLSGDTCRTVQGEEFPIQVWWINGRINSAYPIVQ